MRKFNHGIRITACRDCKERHVGCHGTCEKYIREREEQLKIKEEIDARRQLHMTMTEIELRRAEDKKKKYR